MSTTRQVLDFSVQTLIDVIDNELIQYTFIPQGGCSPYRYEICQDGQIVSISNKYCIPAELFGTNEIKAIVTDACGNRGLGWPFMKILTEIPPMNESGCLEGEWTTLNNVNFNLFWTGSVCSDVDNVATTGVYVLDPSGCNCTNADNALLVVNIPLPCDRLAKLLPLFQITTTWTLCDDTTKSFTTPVFPIRNCISGSTVLYIYRLPLSMLGSGIGVKDISVTFRLLQSPTAIDLIARVRATITWC